MRWHFPWFMFIAAYNSLDHVIGLNMQSQSMSSLGNLLLSRVKFDVSWPSYVMTKLRNGKYSFMLASWKLLFCRIINLLSVFYFKNEVICGNSKFIWQDKFSHETSNLMLVWISKSHDREWGAGTSLMWHMLTFRIFFFKFTRHPPRLLCDWNSKKLPWYFSKFSPKTPSANEIRKSILLQTFPEGPHPLLFPKKICSFVYLLWRFSEILWCF